MSKHYVVKPCSQQGYSWCVESWVTGRRQRKFFRSRRAATNWAELRNIEVLNSGLNALSVSEEQRVEVQRSMLLLEPYGKTILEAVNVALPVFEAAHHSKTVGEAVAALIKAKAEEGLSARYLGDMRSRLGLFSSVFGSRLLPLIGTGELKDWLRALPCSSVGKNNMRRLLSVLYSFAVEAEWCSDNPVKRIRAFPKASRKIGILRPDQAAALLAAASPVLQPILAIGLFAGLRRSELLRVSSSSVRFESGLIQVDVTKTTTAARRFVQIRPNLRLWLERFRGFRALSALEFQRHFRSAREQAGIDLWPHNAMRHSFCSYALAADQDLNKLVLEMGHTNPHTLFAHYRELVTPEDARAYWAIEPNFAAMTPKIRTV